jgi:hypothetical protein
MSVLYHVSLTRQGNPGPCAQSSAQRKMALGAHPVYACKNGKDQPEIEICVAQQKPPPSHFAIQSSGAPSLAGKSGYRKPEN